MLRFRRALRWSMVACIAAALALAGAAVSAMAPAHPLAVAVDVPHGAAAHHGTAAHAEHGAVPPGHPSGEDRPGPGCAQLCQALCAAVGLVTPGPVLARVPAPVSSWPRVSQSARQRTVAPDPHPPRLA